MRRLLVVCAALILAGAGDSTEPPRTPQAQAKLDKWLANRVPGRHEACLATGKTNEPIGIDDHTLLFREGPRIWRNDLRRSTGCDKLGKQYSLVTSANMSGGRLCTGNVVGVIDMHDPSVVLGACELGEFVLYEKP